MALFRKDPPLPEEQLSAIQFNKTLSKSLREKADHNKSESQFCFLVVICASVISPIFVTLGGEGVWLSKVVPSCLSAGAAIATAWLQLRKPQRLWVIYRRGQRNLEHQHALHSFGLADYSDATKKDTILGERSAKIALDIHNQWEGLAPDPDGAVESKSKEKEYP